MPPTDRAKLFHTLHDRYQSLCHTYREFCALFCDKRNVDILNGSDESGGVGGFFAWLQRRLICDLVIQITGLAETPHRSRARSLTVDHLVSTVFERAGTSDEEKRARELMDVFLQAASKLRQFRNKVCAHHDLQVALEPDAFAAKLGFRWGEVVAAIDALAVLLKYIATHIEEPVLSPDDPLFEARALSLVVTVKKGGEYRRLYRSHVHSKAFQPGSDCTAIIKQMRRDWTNSD